jgi:NTP pyrophosphatase (non-canonical NTP hydrolase)
MTYSINGWCRIISSWRKSKGFVTPASLTTVTRRNQMLGKLMLVVSEVAEAAESVRHNEPDSFREEIADVLIRLFDICGTMEIDIGKEIERKMKINKTRPIRHGKHCSL